jgi:hypothetical protein
MRGSNVSIAGTGTAILQPLNIKQSNNQDS